MGSGPFLTSAAAWTWSVSGAGAPVVTKYSSGASTKSGVQPSDLRAYVGVPLQVYGNPPIPMQDTQIVQIIRWAEDWLEHKTNLLLCQSWIASPPASTQLQAQAIGITPAGSGVAQRLGIDYDIEDAAYDFMLPRARDEGWMVYSLRYRPVKSLSYTSVDNDAFSKAIKKIAFIYPLLSEFFAVPPTWIVEDHDFGLVRLVPSANVAMLPLFAMQLSVMGFAESLPGALWMQYTAGLTPSDYQTRYSFITELVLATAAITALGIVQGSINFGIEQQSVNIDGVQYQTKFPKEGPYSGLIKQFASKRDDLMATARDMVSGPIITTL
jgi:hypothetical protein